MCDMTKSTSRDGFDVELEELPADLRWREWMGRIEAVLFASASPVPRADLQRVIGRQVSLDLLIEDLRNDLEGRPYEIAQIGSGWTLRTRARFAPAIRAAADISEQEINISARDMTVLAAIAYNQPVTRDELGKILGREVSRDAIGRLSARALITTGPRAPQRGAPHSFVTTDAFLAAFDFAHIGELPDLDAELVDRSGISAAPMPGADPDLSEPLT